MAISNKKYLEIIDLKNLVIKKYLITSDCKKIYKNALGLNNLVRFFVVKKFKKHTIRHARSPPIKF